MGYISEDYCSEELSGRLIEKGYIGSTNTYLSKDDLNVEQITLQSAMKYLREEKGVQIEISIVGMDTWESPTKWTYGFRCQTKDVIDRRNTDFPSYKEACETAIKYCLENLI